MSDRTAQTPLAFAALNARMTKSTGSRSGTARPFPLWRLASSPHSPPIDPITRESYCPQARIAGLLTFRALAGSAHPAALISIAQECGAFATHRALSRLSISRICTCIRVSARPLRRFLPQLFGHLRPEIGGTRRGGVDLYEAAAPGWERGNLGSYRGALDLRWHRSAGSWIRAGVGGPARSRRGQCWTAGRVCTLFSFRNDPPEESRSPCVARARGELGDGVCFRTCSRRVGATGVNEPRRFFRRAFSLRPETRFIRRALCGRGHLCRRDGGRREQRTELCTLAIAGSGGARNSSTYYRPIHAEACTGRFITARECCKKTSCDCGAIEGFDLTGLR